MNEKEALEYIKTAAKRGSVYGLEPMKNLLKELDNPEDDLQFIHVGGTNGKGSVSSFLTSVLAENGQKVGRYISPSVFSYEEKIQYITKTKTHRMSKEEMVWSVEKVAAAVERLKKKSLAEPTVFEIETAMAFLLFKKWKTDIVVLEVGLGGESDATNVIRNVPVTVITPISMDHIAILGNSIEEIAGQKAGIIKEGHHVFTLQKDIRALQVIRQRCLEKNAVLHEIMEKDYRVGRATVFESIFSYQGKDYRTRMTGVYQIENAALAIAVCQYLKMKQIEHGIYNALWPGRFEVLKKKPLVIIDGAHNESGAKALEESIQLLLPGKKIYGIYGIFADKDYKEVSARIIPHLEEVIAVPAEGKRSLPPDKLAQVCRKYISNVTASPDVKEALRTIETKAGDEDVILAFGSLSFLQQIKEEIENEKFE